MKPALTPEEWASWLATPPPSWSRAFPAIENAICRATDEAGLGRNTHALAALALHGQGFGFSREDVTRIKNDAAVLRARLSLQGPVATWDFPQVEIDGIRARISWLDSLAARIEALLPPEDK